MTRVDLEFGEPKLLIDGDLVETEREEGFETRNPATRTDDVDSTGTEADTDCAITAMNRVFEYTQQ